jgi:hypothetical protein
MTQFCHVDAGDVPILDAAVLWRGAPGWFYAGDPAAQSSGFKSSTLPDGRRGPGTNFVAVGVLRLEVTFDPPTGLLQLHGETIAVQDANVILVDDVDGASGPRIVDKVWIDPGFPGSAMDSVAIVRRAPAILPFLRCDVPYPPLPRRPDTEMKMRQQMADAQCARIATR